MTATPVPLRDFLFGLGVGVIAGELGHIFFDNDNYRWTPHHWTYGPPLVVAGGVWGNWFIVGLGAGFFVHDAGDFPKIFDTKETATKDEPSWVETAIKGFTDKGEKKE